MALETVRFNLWWRRSRRSIKTGSLCTALTALDRTPSVGQADLKLTETACLGLSIAGVGGVHHLLCAHPFSVCSCFYVKRAWELLSSKPRDWMDSLDAEKACYTGQGPGQFPAPTNTYNSSSRWTRCHLKFKVCSFVSSAIQDWGVQGAEEWIPLNSSLSVVKSFNKSNWK